MFSTQKNLNFLAICDTVLINSTFHPCSPLSAQIFIVHGKLNNTNVPVAYFLLPEKTETIYCVAVCKLRSLFTSAYVPDTVLFDFELAIYTAMVRAWPTVKEVTGCIFHLGQAWFRKLQGLDLMKTYESASMDSSFLRTLFGMAFLKPKEVGDFLLKT